MTGKSEGKRLAVTVGLTSRIQPARRSAITPPDHGAMPCALHRAPRWKGRCVLGSGLLNLSLALALALALSSRVARFPASVPPCWLPPLMYVRLKGRRKSVSSQKRSLMGQGRSKEPLLRRSRSRQPTRKRGLRSQTWTVPLLHQPRRTAPGRLTIRHSSA